ncbi:hypothetical protein J0X14_10755 [Muricauda sp. CAU 1633]|uniref:DUF5694 domain-containing protein n=1 Tax=Allomuricauda sp. CAU 1633 TaxID=2816036 RepID=UPI001A8DB9BA|nr:DUF5694 domain-containing protein [Muricauda sp. CAU 1633]MBO0322778.1 hypothetical protein [Muricauda sp. CAU 1633]
MIKKIQFSLITLLVFVSCTSPTEKPENSQPENTKQALLIGTFHYHNPGADVAKTKSFDVLSDASQVELEEISEKIKAYHPDQVFVEWPYDEQQELDSLYQLYLEDNYFTNDSLSDFYLKNEIFQLAFRVAKKVGLKSVQAVDYQNTDFPFDSLMTVAAMQNQTDLQQQFTDGIERFTQEFDEKIKSGATLLEMTYYLNTEELRRFSNEFQTQVPLLVGDRNNFVGAYLASEWYRRNVYMWSLAQKATQPDNQRIMLLLGASHIAMIKDFIDQNEEWTAVELNEIMEKRNNP